MCKQRSPLSVRLFRGVDGLQVVSYISQNHNRTIYIQQQADDRALAFLSFLIREGKVNKQTSAAASPFCCGTQRAERKGRGEILLVEMVHAVFLLGYFILKEECYYKLVRPWDVNHGYYGLIFKNTAKRFFDIFERYGM